MADPDDHGDVVLVRLDVAGPVRLTWRSGLRIDGALAQRAMGLVDELNGTQERPTAATSPAAGASRRATSSPPHRCSRARRG